MNRNKHLGYDQSGVLIAAINTGIFNEKVEMERKNIVPSYHPNPETLIWVRSNLKPKRDGGFPLSFQERNEAHPENGEAFVAGEKPSKIALTAAASDALNEGRIIEVSADEAFSWNEANDEKIRTQIKREKDSFRLRYIQLTGGTGGLEMAWANYTAKKAGEAIAAELNS